MDIEIRTEGEVAKLDLSGSLVATSAGELVSHVTVLNNCGFKRILIDMGKVDFMDSLGLRACIAMHKLSLRENGVLVISNPSDAVNRIFDITKANMKLNVTPDLKSGMERLKQ